jgi:uncharacterized repeat protein (TIGR01451 family)
MPIKITRRINMATRINNQATLTFNYAGTTETALSNVASTTLLEPLNAAKNSLESEYRLGDEITYIISMVNTGQTTMTNIQIVDDLGTYTIAGPISVTPLTYLGPAKLYRNGIYVGEITATTDAHSVTFPVGTLATGVCANVIYKAVVNEYALLEAEEESKITNTGTLTATGLNDPVTFDKTIAVEEYADVEIIKCMSPNPVTDGGLLTYKFTITNSGNTEATDIVLTDVFNPAPTSISVTLDDVTVDPSNYTYENGTLTLPTGEDYTISVPKATFEQDPATGEVTITPSSVVIVVSGTI